MTPSFDQLKNQLKKLPGFGVRSAERIALHLLLEKPQAAEDLLNALEHAREQVGQCPVCGNITERGLREDDFCDICLDTSRNRNLLCVVEQIPDLISMEKSGAYRGLYHVLHGKLSPINGIGEEDLNLVSLKKRLAEEPIEEVILALSNDIEGEATCNFLKENYFDPYNLSVTRIGFGLPSGGNLFYADSTTLRSALDGRRDY